jgi:hypothetical protein
MELFFLSSEVAMKVFILGTIEGKMYSAPLDELLAYGDGTTPTCDLLRRKIEAEAATAIEAARDGYVGNAGPDKKRDE